MNKILLTFAAIFTATCVFAHGHGPYRPAPYHHHHHHHSVWGPGGSYFWPGFVGGLVAGTVVRSTPAPVVVQQPVVYQQPAVVAPVVAAPVVTTPVVSAPVVVR